MRELSIAEMKAVSGGNITVVGTRPEQSWWEKQLIMDMLSEGGETISAGEGSMFGDGGGGGFTLPLPSWDDIMRIVMGETNWRENHPNNDFNANDAVRVEQTSAGQDVYIMADGSYWVDVNKNGTPDTHVWVTDVGAMWDSNMDGNPDTPIADFPYMFG